MIGTASFAKFEVVILKFSILTKRHIEAGMPTDGCRKNLFSRVFNFESCGNALPFENMPNFEHKIKGIDCFCLVGCFHTKTNGCIIYALQSQGRFANKAMARHFIKFPLTCVFSLKKASAHREKQRSVRRPIGRISHPNIFTIATFYRVNLGTNVADLNSQNIIL